MITTYGRDFVWRPILPGALQSWVRFDEGWRIVAGHVSVIDEPKPP